MADKAEDTQQSATAAGSEKKLEKRTPKKLRRQSEQQQQPTPDPSPEPADVSSDRSAGFEGGNEANAADEDVAHGVSRRPENPGRGRQGAQESDTESIARSDLSATGGGRRNRQRTAKRTAQKERQGGANPLGGIAEGLPGGELVNNATDLVQDTAGSAVNTVGNAVNTVGNAAGDVVGGVTGKKDGEGKEQLRLRLELNLDIEVQLKAKIHGDITLGLLN